MCNYSVLILRQCHSLYQMGFLIFVLFVTYFMIPLGLRVNTVLSVSLCVFHLVLSTAVAEETPADILGREVCISHTYLFFLLSLLFLLLLVLSSPFLFLYLSPLYIPLFSLSPSLHLSFSSLPPPRPPSHTLSPLNH